MRTYAESAKVRWGDEFGVWINLFDGWQEIVFDLFVDLDEIGALKLSDGSSNISGVKQKYGALRVYLHESTDAAEDKIKIAEQRSVKTCEVCGADGRLRRGGWIYTLCDQHAAARSEGTLNGTATD